jgi:hypothetical protein
LAVLVFLLLGQQLLAAAPLLLALICLQLEVVAALWVWGLVEI